MRLITFFVMGKKHIPVLSAANISELTHHYMHGENHFFRQRCHLVLLKYNGYTSRHITTLPDYPDNMTTINNWVKRYESLGIEGLKTKEGQGRKTILNLSEHEAQVKEIVQSERQRLDVAKSLIEEKLGVRMSKQTLIRFLKKI